MHIKHQVTHIQSLLAVALGFYVQQLAQAQTVDLNGVSIVGSTYAGAATEFFGGIPFASPPIDELRFSPPVLQLTPNVSTLDASGFGPICPQNPSGQFTTTIGVPSSEDCLTINVFRPQNTTSSDSLPVMVWVYGGAFTEGGSSTFNASAIIGKSILRGSPVIYVNFNYRVGALGYPIGSEAASKGALNLGDKDALAALEWVQANIGAFGGDKDQVTIFGESAGAMIIAQLLLDPDFSLAQAAILESGSAASIPIFNASRAGLDSWWSQFVSNVTGCANATSGNTIDCLRAASLEDLIAAQTIVLDASRSGLVFLPVIDGPGGVIPDSPATILASGSFAQLPLLMGTNKDEGTIFVSNQTSSDTEVAESLELQTSLDANQTAQVVSDMLQLYPNVPALGCPFDTGNETFGLNPEYKRAAAIETDAAFAALRRNLAQTVSGIGLPVYTYLFTDPQPAINTPSLGVYHSAEVNYVYGAATNGDASVVLSDTMMDYWLSFATSLTPNDGLGNSSRPNWNAYGDGGSVLELNSENMTMIPDDFRKDQIAYIIAHPQAYSH